MLWKIDKSISLKFLKFARVILNNNWKAFFVFLVALSITRLGIGQTLERTVLIRSTPTQISDSLLIIPSTISIRNATGQIQISNHVFYPSTNSIQVNKRENDSLIILKYRVLNNNFYRRATHKNISHQIPLKGFIIDPFTYIPSTNLSDWKKQDRNLDISGQYMRGITLGNNQNLSSSSNFNLRMQGRLTNDIEINAVLADNQIPIQPEGNTAQIQDFDNLFIQLKKDNSILTAGDYYLKQTAYPFLRFDKKLQGLLLFNSDSIRSGIRQQSKIAVAVTKGKYNRQTINGKDQNQGPYRLKGANGELFIIIIAGTERVYINGELMQRGAGADYYIDYNTGELTFTAKRLINNQSRIIVEFQYAERNYLRTTIFAEESIKTKNGSFDIQFFQEQDAKNQPQENFKAGAKSILASIGDSVQSAYIGSELSSSFDPNKILYKKVLKDTLGYIDSIFVYTTESTSNLFQVNFTNVGKGNGEYVVSQSLANGKVFRYVGRRNGDYLPISILIAPQRKQMVSLSGDYLINGILFKGNFSLSDYNHNLFSNVDKSDDKGIASQIDMEKVFAVNRWKIIPGLHFIGIQKEFSAIENFQTQEYARDWNLGSNTSLQQNYIHPQLKISRSLKQTINYDFERLLIGSYKNYSGDRHTINLDWNERRWRVKNKSSLLNSKNDEKKSSFVRQDMLFSVSPDKHQKSEWTIHYNEENNRWKDSSLQYLKTSFHNKTLGGIVKNTDSSKAIYSIQYDRRWDFHPQYVSDSLFQRADQIQSRAGFKLNDFQRIQIIGNWRYLALTNSKNKQTLLAQLSYEGESKKGIWHWQSAYESGTIQEPKRQYAFLKVPDGQGHFSWIDLNGDGVQQLNEFTENDYTNNLRYDKVFIPTNEYVAANQILWNGMLNLDFSNANANEETEDEQKDLPWYKQWSWQGNSSYLRKALLSEGDKGYLPFSSISDSSIIGNQLSLQSSFSIKPSSNNWYAWIIWNKNQGRMLTTLGLENKGKQEWLLKGRVPLFLQIELQPVIMFGTKFTDNTYNKVQAYSIDYFTYQPVLFWLKQSNRISIDAQIKKLKHIQNEITGKSQIIQYTADYKWAKANLGQFTGKVQYATVRYPYATNTILALNVLEGLRPGRNLLAGINWEKRTKSGLEWTIGYEIRQNGANTRWIQMGRMTLRALF